jgi:hypothetical protein
MTKNSNKDFKLRKFSLEFERGYSWEKESEKQKDRYEWSVTFTNDLREEFTLNVDTELSLEIIKLISNKLTENTERLVKNITESIITE